ncbi:hypothetical protein IB237_12940 [Agrobacterium sp. AGB01]|uniref:hypothetical protein n=1 Tax=Agrobacterium sp. AGB01 TaxID=2769302 RepID=UPI001784991B|nr:hypothetical protein [Agrobacterium sp. AGB01]MBD9388087.1 hypothetical protein [Agrobacterium sp. AGB01]
MAQMRAWKHDIHAEWIGYSRTKTYTMTIKNYTFLRLLISCYLVMLMHQKADAQGNFR